MALFFGTKLSKPTKRYLGCGKLPTGGFPAATRLCSRPSIPLKFCIVLNVL
jgi:hypothetical protein